MAIDRCDSLVRRTKAGRRAEIGCRDHRSAIAAVHTAETVRMNAPFSLIPGLPGFEEAWEEPRLTVDHRDPPTLTVTISEEEYVPYATAVTGGALSAKDEERHERFIAVHSLIAGPSRRLIKPGDVAVHPHIVAAVVLCNCLQGKPAEVLSAAMLCNLDAGQLHWSPQPFQADVLCFGGIVQHHCTSDLVAVDGQRYGVSVRTSCFVPRCDPPALVEAGVRGERRLPFPCGRQDAQGERSCHAVIVERPGAVPPENACHVFGARRPAEALGEHWRYRLASRDIRRRE